MKETVPTPDTASRRHGLPEPMVGLFHLEHVGFAFVAAGEGPADAPAQEAYAGLVEGGVGGAHLDREGVEGASPRHHQADVAIPSRSTW